MFYTYNKQLKSPAHILPCPTHSLPRAVIRYEMDETAENVQVAACPPELSRGIWSLQYNFLPFIKL